MKKIIIPMLAAACLLSAPAFSGCGSGSVNYTLSEEGGKHYVVSCSGLYGLNGEYEIPAYYGEGDNYAPVTEIAAEGFANSAFTKITVPATVTEIGTAAFSFCYSLETVEFADGIKLDSFSHGLFGGSSNLQSVKIPDSVKSVERLVFSGCTKLAYVDAGSIEVIGARAFEKCTALESVVLPDTLTTIGEGAFYRSGLKEIEIPDSVRDRVDGETTVKGLGYAAFNNCLSLEKVKIGGGIKIITSGAFGYCLALKEIYIPLSVEEVQGASYYENGSFRYGHAFYSTPALTDVYYAGSEQQWKDIKIETKNAYENNMTMDNSTLIAAEKHYNS